MIVLPWAVPPASECNYRVAAYATLSMTTIDRSACARPLARKAPSRVPALLIGRLATDASVSGLGLGTQMVRHILSTAVGLNHSAACRAVIVNALNVEACDADDPADLDLYLLPGDIEATMRNIQQSGRTFHDRAIAQ